MSLPDGHTTKSTDDELETAMNVLHEESVQYCSVNYSYIAVCHQGGIVFDDATVATSNNRRNLSRHISQDPRHHDHRRSVSF